MTGRVLSRVEVRLADYLGSERAAIAVCAVTPPADSETMVVKAMVAALESRLGRHQVEFICGERRDTLR